MLRQLNAIERTVGFLESLSWQEGALRTLYSRTRIEDARSSILIEGGDVSFERAFQLAQQSEATRQNITEAEREFLNYLHAFEIIDGLRGKRDYQVRAGDVKNLHQYIVDGVRGGARFAGQFRQEDVVVGDRHGEDTLVHHTPPSFFEVEREIEALTDWINRSAAKVPFMPDQPCEDCWVHPVIIAGIAQHRLVWIHPFVDGNGRTARLFTALLLLYRGYDFQFLFDLSSYYNAHRDEYYATLREADASGDYTHWLTFFMGGFANQMYGVRENARRAAQGIVSHIARDEHV